MAVGGTDKNEYFSLRNPDLQNDETNFVYLV